MKTSLKIVAALAVLLCFAFAIPKPERKVFTVVIEAAHGGKDFGAVHEGQREKDIVRQVAKEISNLNRDIDVVFYTFNEADEFVPLEDRVKAINGMKPDLVLSLHVNAAKTGDPSGMEVFISNSTTHFAKSSELAGKLANKFKAENFAVKEVKQAPFYILKNVDAPAIHFEMGYLTNNEDMIYLTSKEGQQMIANTVNNFIKDIK